MKKILLLTALAAALPVVASAEMKMQNSNPNAGAKEEPTLGHHMQNTNPNPEPEAVPAEKPEHVMQNSDPSPDAVPKHKMQNTNPKKWVSTNAGALEGMDSK